MVKQSKKATAQVVSPVEVAQVAPEAPVTTKAPLIRYAQRTWQPNWVIGNVKANPKRGVSQSRYAQYRNGMTVAEYVAAVVAIGQSAAIANADLRWDTAPHRAFITIEPPQGA